MNKKTVLILIIGFIVTIILTALITSWIVKPDEKEAFERIKINNTEKNTSDIKHEEENNENSEEEKSANREEITPIDKSEAKAEIVKEDNEYAKEDTKTTEKTTVKENQDIPESSTKKEENVINYIEEISNEEDENKLKNGFITVIDFLFYDGKIHNKTFDELSNNAKLKVISYALKIDAKIEEKLPGYKESIASTSKKVYTNIKSKLITIYLDTTVKICNNNAALCDEAKENLNDLKDTFNISWSFVKEISGVGLAKLKNWYEIWKKE